jgi:hypothetical protein
MPVAYQPNTYGSELLRLANLVGLADDGGASLPNDQGTLRTLQEAYLEAAEEFCRSRAWSWQCPEFSVTLSTDGLGAQCVEGSITRYNLGEHLTGQPFSASVEDTWYVDACDSGYLRQRLAQFPNESGWPEAIAFIDQINGDAIHTHLLVFPRPDSARVLKFRAQRAIQLPGDLGGLLPWGDQHHQTVRRLAEYRLAARGQSEGSPDVDALKRSADLAMQQSVTMDEATWGSGRPMRNPTMVGAGRRHRYRSIVGI